MLGTSPNEDTLLKDFMQAVLLSDMALILRAFAEGADLSAVLPNQVGKCDHLCSGLKSNSDVHH